MIKVSQLKKSVPSSDGTLEILRGISFEIKAGETVAVVGVSGSGKSTLLGLLAGLDRLTEGEIEIDGMALSALDEDGRASLRADKIGFVFQSFQLLDALTALENVMLPLELSGHTDAEAQAKRYLTAVGLSHRLDHRPQKLSGGEQQRVAVARAFAAEPKILFADEPTGNLDSQTGAKITDLIFELNAAQGTTLVLVTHDEQLASRCDRRLRMTDGILTEDGA